MILIPKLELQALARAGRNLCEHRLLCRRSGGELHLPALALPALPAGDLADPQIVVAMPVEQHIAGLRIIHQRRAERLAARPIPPDRGGLAVDLVHHPADPQAVAVPHVARERPRALHEVVDHDAVVRRARDPAEAADLARCDVRLRRAAGLARRDPALGSIGVVGDQEGIRAMTPIFHRIIDGHIPAAVLGIRGDVGGPPGLDAFHTRWELQHRLAGRKVAEHWRTH